ncbi:MAG: hypothetical protein P8J87_07565 [Verrucomicrobiales bacterium]|nr:hypothetical protein [Verrucomicrobiales bacterium]
MRLILVLTGLLTGPALSQSLSVDKPFPHIKLPDIDRSEVKALHSIADFNGQKTVVHIFAGW